VHENPIIEGKIGVITAKVIYKYFKTIEHYIAKHSAYLSWEAPRYLELTETTNSVLSLNQKIKYGLLTTGLLPLVYFIGVYFLN
jgi:hypothetical protein